MSEENEYDGHQAKAGNHDDIRELAPRSCSFSNVEIEAIKPADPSEESKGVEQNDRPRDLASTPGDAPPSAERGQPLQHSIQLPLKRLWAPRPANPSSAEFSDGHQAESQTYVLRVCRALIMYGAPAHRLETYMHHTADALQLHLQAFYLPSCMIISFDDNARRSVDVQIITCPQALNLAKLDDLHSIYKDVIHQRLDVQHATPLLDDLLVRGDKYPRWVRVVMYGLASAFIGPVSYGARPIDLPIIFLLGSLVGLLDLVVAAHSELYGYLFEMSSAILVSFVARALGSFQWDGHNDFCFSAIAQASLVLILPGFMVTSSALELQSRMMITGAVRLVYGIIYTLFLAFGFIVGTTVYGAIDSNATSSTTCTATWPFWWQVIFVIPFTFCYVIVNQAKWKQMPAMLVVTMAGWLVNHFSAQRFPTVQSLPNALGALTIGVLANLYSRLAHGLAIAVMHPAIFILVPGSFAASGSLISGLTSANELTHQGANVTSSIAPGTFASGKSSALYAGYAMVEIAIGITAGLSVSALLIYPIRKKAGKGGLFSY